MAETPSKRPREETQIDDVDETKRHKSYNHILSLLEAEEEEPTQDLSSLITTLQQELTPDSVLDPISSQTADKYLEISPTTATGEDSVADSSTSPTSSCSKEDEEDDGQRVIRHLLEASDDELGIPNMDVVCAENGVYGDGDFNGGDVIALSDGLLWELEDEAANYYTMLQSELFM